MTTDLSEELTALAETQTFSPDPAAWDRGRRARRRDRVVRSAAVVTVVGVIAGSAALVARPDPVGPADDAAPDGAIPSRITTPDDPTPRAPDIGRASVAYVDAEGSPVLVDATTGEAHVVELPDFPVPESLERGSEYRRGPWLALSPDGRRLAYPTTQGFVREQGVIVNQTSWYRVVDLTTGESDLVDLPPYGTTPIAMSWTTDGRIAVDVFGRPTRRTSETNPPPTISWTIDPENGASASAPMTGVTAPGGGISAPYPTDDDAVRAMPFETATGTDLERTLPRDLYPDGAVVSPVGWADNSLLVAQVDAPEGGHVKGEHLVLMTSPDRPESEWTWRILVKDVPATQSVSLAVDLLPDLDGSSAQELTHDFTAEAEQPMGDTTGVVSFLVSAGFFVLLGVGIAVVALIRMVRRRA